VRWHFIFESLAYFVAFRIYLAHRKSQGDFLGTTTRWSIVAAAFVGAVLGAKLLYLLENPAETLRRWNDVTYLLQGKTMVGALAGGTLAVELTKLRIGVKRRTGDLFAIPITIGIAIGRVGCFLAGKLDDTYGLPTALPWGLDLGDGIPRHPVQLYEVAAMLGLALCLSRISPPRFAEGDRFRIFMLAYFAWRLFVDSLKPGVRFDGLTLLQWVCAAGLLFYTPDLVRMMSASLKWQKLKSRKPKEPLLHG
jgi:phosphatidylglycerol:prolipoprotein diacylglycerol transferase